MPGLRLSTCLVAVFLYPACAGSTETPRTPPPSPYGQQPYGQAPYGQSQYPSQYGAPGYAPAPYGQPGSNGAPPGYGPLPNGSTAPPVGNTAPPAGNTQLPLPVPQLFNGPDPITNTDVVWLRREASSVITELENVLPPAARAKVQGIPLAIDDTPGLVNAFATCTRGKAAMVVSDGLLNIVAHLAQARANDELFGTQKVDEYDAFIARRQQPNAPIAEPPANFFDRNQQTDSRRVARQHDVFDETLGFVLGHELAHHHLGHLPCTAGAGFLGMGDIARDLSSAVPIFNQPNEIAADSAGTNNVLVAGARRTGSHWTEGGALLIMRFFAAIDQLSPTQILFAFESTHPPPFVRVPVIQQTANLVRIAGNGWLPFPSG